MDAFPAVFVFSLVILLHGKTHQLPQVPATETPALQTIPIVLPVEGEKKNCSTARDVQGSCVSREICDYSTYAIDLTLYMPKDYKRPCVSGQVCCPFDSILTARPPYDDKQSYGFDDDDRRRR